MKPRLPGKPIKDVDMIAASWICQLLDCLAYAMDNPRGDGSTIINTATGKLRAIICGGGSSGGGGDVLRKAIITAKTTTWVYTADIYDDPDDDPIEEDAVIRVSGGSDELASGETIPTGAMVDVKPQRIDDSVNVSTYTIIGLPRSL